MASDLTSQSGKTKFHRPPKPESSLLLRKSAKQSIAVLETKNWSFHLYCSKLQNLLAENTAHFGFFFFFWYLMFLNMSMINVELMNVSVCNLLLRFFGFPQTLTLAWKACKANCVTSLSSSSLKVLLTTVGSSVNKLRQALITLAILVPFWLW